MTCECFNGQETPAVSTPLAYADDHLSAIASAILLLDPGLLTFKQSAFLAQLLMTGLMRTPCSQCSPQMALQVRYPPLNPHRPKCLSLGTTYRILSRFYGLRLRVWSNGPAWRSSRGRQTIYMVERDEEMTLPDPEIPLVYSLHYVQYGCQDWEENDKVQCQIQECIDATNAGTTSRHVSLCFLVAENLAPPGLTFVCLSFPYLFIALHFCCPFLSVLYSSYHGG